MLWHVHGKDATTGQRVTLSVEDAAPTLAVQAALGKQILVSRVVRGKWLERRAVRNAIVPLAAAAICVLVPLCYGLYALNTMERVKSAEAIAQREKLANSLATLLAKTKMSFDVETQTYASEMELTRRRAAQLEGELAAARGEAEKTQARVAELNGVVTAVPGMQKELEEARRGLKETQGKVKELERLLGEKTARAAELQKLSTELQGKVKKAGEAEAAAKKALAEKGQLAKQNELLKAQLLELAAKVPEVRERENVETVVEVGGGRPWALAISRDAAMDFLALRFTKDSVTRTGPVGGIQTTRALHGQNACTITIHADGQRVYSGVFTASLAAEAPKERIAENMEAMTSFAAAFAPEWKGREAWLQSGIKALAGRPRNERVQVVGEQYQATLWRDGADVFSLKIESPLSALDN